MAEQTSPQQEEEEFEEDEGPADWVVTFSDMMTLLLCFFVLLFSMSEIKLNSFVDVVASLQTEIGKHEIPMSGTKQNLNAVTKGEASKKDTAADEEGTKVIKDLTRVKSKTEEYISKNVFKGQVDVTLDDREAAVRLDETILFNSSSQQLNTDAVKVLDLLWQAIKDFEFSVRVEGHMDPTDKVPPKFKNGYEFTASRAATVAKYFIKRGFNPEQLSVGGFGGFRPIRSSKTEEGRKINRRVEVVMVRESVLKEKIEIQAAQQ